MYPHTPKGNRGKTDGVLINTPGKELFTTAEPEEGLGCRGKHTTAKGRAFQVFGNTLFELNTNGTLTKQGVIGTVTGRVSIADNGLVLNILDGVNGYFYNFNTGVFTVITDENFPKTARTVVYIDTYFIWCADGSDFFFLSDNNAYDPASCTDGEFGRADNQTDEIVTAVVRGNDIIFFGTESIEFWYNSANPEFPIARNPGSTSQVGCGARDSVQEIAGNVFFLGGGSIGHGVVYVIPVTGYKAIEISTDDIDQRNQEETTLEGSFGATDQHGGNKFYLLTIVSTNKTLAYDIQRKRWHERAQILENGEFGREPLSYTIFYNNKQYVADFSNNEISEYSRDFPTDRGETIPRLLRLPHIFKGTERVRVSSLHVDVQKGKGSTGGDPGETEPLMTLKVSKDGGATFTDFGAKQVGEIGVYKGRISWHRVGQARDIVMELYYTGRQTIEINGVFAEVTQ
jgi:hypothetical protein